MVRLFVSGHAKLGIEVISGYERLIASRITDARIKPLKDKDREIVATTHQSSIRQLIQWLGNPDKKKRLLSLQGPPGSSTSSILAYANKICQDTDSLAVATFSFDESHTSDFLVKHLCATVIHDLAQRVPRLLENLHLVCRDVERTGRTDAVKKTIATQVEGILAPAFSLTDRAGQAGPLLVLLDKIDHAPEESKKEIQEFIKTCLRNIQSMYFITTIAIRGDTKQNILADPGLGTEVQVVDVAA